MTEDWGHQECRERRGPFCAVCFPRAYKRSGCAGHLAASLPLQQWDIPHLTPLSCALTAQVLLAPAAGPEHTCASQTQQRLTHSLSFSPLLLFAPHRCGQLSAVPSDAAPHYCGFSPGPAAVPKMRSVPWSALCFRPLRSAGHARASAFSSECFIGQ